MKVKVLMRDWKHCMRQNHQVHYHQRMNQRQLLVRFSIVFVTFILVALTLIYTGTLLLPSSQTDDYEYDDYHAVEFFSSPTARTQNGTTCARDSEGCCQNGGICFIIEGEGVKVCQCPDFYGGKRCEKYLWYH